VICIPDDRLTHVCAAVEQVARQIRVFSRVLSTDETVRKLMAVTPDGLASISGIPTA
jgi:hypothetical protein